MVYFTIIFEAILKLKYVMLAIINYFVVILKNLKYLSQMCSEMMKTTKNANKIDPDWSFLDV